ncbi:hypothetical protein EPI10_015794 [Gossypium australe]|uniref:Uncharacterized protein n=1 Tax=Gossypium australe TaxID=47621 RepID=A0A5B6VM46_9ROSI|nr:hypothetical protein EPI10_015794 [Gossypium australe]
MELLVPQELECKLLKLSSQGLKAPKASIEKPPKSKLNEGRKGLTQSWVFDQGKFKSQWLEARVIYPNSYSYSVSPVEHRLEKDESTTITNDDNKLILTITDTIYCQYRYLASRKMLPLGLKLNTREISNPLPHIHIQNNLVVAYVCSHTYYHQPIALTLLHRYS